MDSETIEKCIEDAREDFRWHGAFSEQMKASLSKHGVNPIILELEWHRQTYWDRRSERWKRSADD